MDQRHAEYVAYYQTRMQRYQGDPLYPRSALAERRLYEAIQGCARLEDFRTVLETQKPELACAIARTLDQSAARAAHFQAMAEPVRARGPEQIGASAGAATDVSALAALVGEIMRKNSLEISVDLFTDMFHGDFKILEDIEVAAAIADQVPAEWRGEVADSVVAEQRRGREHYQAHTQAEARKWAPGWDLDYDLIAQERHRRRIPEPDPVVAKRIEQHQRYIGRK